MVCEWHKGTASPSLTQKWWKLSPPRCKYLVRTKFVYLYIRLAYIGLRLCAHVLVEYVYVEVEWLWPPSFENLLHHCYEYIPSIGWMWEY